MSIATGTVQVKDNGTIKSFKIVGATPPKTFVDPPSWVWDLVKGNAGESVTVDYSTPPDTINSVEVG